MTLTELINGLDIIETSGDLSLEVDTIVYDSRKARQGALFVCIEGFVTDGHQYALQAQRQAGPDEQVNENDFRYPGPSPRSKETSIRLLADTCEAAVRAVKPGSREEMETLVDRLIDEPMMSGELDESQLTFADLRTVRSVFLQVLQGVHHPRIVYPEPAKPEAPAQDASPQGHIL